LDNAYCYYLEYGVEEDKTSSFHLGAFIHHLSDEAAYGGDGLTTDLAYQSVNLTVPADVTALSTWTSIIESLVLILVHQPEFGMASSFLH